MDGRQTALDELTGTGHRTSILSITREIQVSPCYVYYHDDGIPSVKGKGKVLLFDDEEIILSSLQRVLKASGYRAITCNESLEAFKLFEKKPRDFDLVITDRTMSGITVLELSRRLLDICPGLPIILCTGFNNAISREEVRSLGIRDLLLKPAGTAEFGNVVRRASGNGSHRNDLFDAPSPVKA